MEITKIGILKECLNETNMQRNKYSRYGNGMLPLEGYEKIFEDLTEKSRLLREMILEQYEKAGAPVLNKPMADWQKDIMDGKLPELIRQEWDMEMAGGEPIRRMMVNGTTDPVVYPGGE